MLALSKSNIMSLVPYVPGLPLKKTLSQIPIVNLASNENCLGPSAGALIAAHESLSLCHLYPNAQRYEVVNVIADHYKDYNITKNQISLGNGSSELIVNLVRGLVSDNESVLSFWPTFVMYSLAAKVHGVDEVRVSLNEKFNYDLDLALEEIYKEREKPVKLIFLANPNNPTGTYINNEQMEYFVKNLPESVVLAIDEAYFEYKANLELPNGLGFAVNRPRTVVLRTFSKIYGLAGLRLGYAIGCEKVIDILSRVRDPFNVNSVVQYASIAALKDQEHVKKSVNHNEEMKLVLKDGLEKLGFEAHIGPLNFLLVKRAKHMSDMKEISQRLEEKGVFVRHLAAYNLNDYMRISVGTKTEIDLFFLRLREIL